MIIGFAGMTPAYLADIDRVLQDIFNCTQFKGISSAGAYAAVVQLSGDGTQSSAGKEIGEYFLHNGSCFRIGDIAAVFDNVSERGDSDSLTPAGFFIHTTLYLFGKVNAVIFVHSFDHSFYDDGHFIIAYALRNRYHFNSALFAEHGFINDTVFTVAGKTAEFPEENSIKGLGLLLCSTDHTVKGGSLLGMAAADTLVHENVFIRQDVAVFLGIFPYLFKL